MEKSSSYSIFSQFFLLSDFYFFKFREYEIIPHYSLNLPLSTSNIIFSYLFLTSLFLSVPCLFICTFKKMPLPCWCVGIRVIKDLNLLSIICYKYNLSVFCFLYFEFSYNAFSYEESYFLLDLDEIISFFVYDCIRSFLRDISYPEAVKYCSIVSLKRFERFFFNHVDV